MNELITEKDDLPEGWTYAKLPCIVTNNQHSIKRGPFGSHLKKECFVKSGYKVYEQQNAINNDCELGTYYINEKKFEEMKAFEVNSGDLLISCSGTIGKITLVPKIFQKGIINQALLKISINSKIMLIPFFSHLFEFLTKKAEIKSHGSGMGNLFSVKVLKEIPILLPPLNEQKRIVVKIESIFAQIDAGKMKLMNVRKLLKQNKQSVLNDAFRGKLTQNWRQINKNNFRIENQQLLEISKDLNIIKQNPTKILGTLYKNKLHKIPEDWCWARLTNIAKIGQGGTPSTRKNEFWDGNIPWLRSGEVKNNLINKSAVFITKLGLQNSSTHFCPKGTVLLAMTGQGLTRGRSAILNIDACTNQSLAHMILYPARIFNKFLFYFLQSQYWKIRGVSKGSNQPGLNVSIIKQFEIPIPILSEQKHIASKIESIFGRIDAIEEQVESSLIKLEQLKTTILKKAFEGKLVHQDPNDEPASVLLEKIKQEKSQIHKK